MKAADRAASRQQATTGTPRPRTISSALDLTFAPTLQRVVDANVKSKSRTGIKLMLVSLLVLTFA